MTGFSPFSPPPFAPPHSDAPHDWVDRLLLAGPGGEECLHLGAPLDRDALRTLVEEQSVRLTAAGLGPGGTAALRLPPSVAFVAVLLACWRLGAQVALLDHRLTDHEIDAAVARLAPQVLVGSAHRPAAALRGFSDVEPVAVRLPDGQPARTGHALIQLSSGSTGPAKVIARTAADLLRELDCYRRLVAFPGEGERVVLLSSVVHVLGLVGGLLNALYVRAALTVPERMTAAGILAAVADSDRPTTVIGVPFHAELLAGAVAPPALPRLRRMIVAGELVRPGLPALFTERYGVPLGTMYGMTETGVIATDLDGTLHPAKRPVHGMRLLLVKGELQLGAVSSPYPGLDDPTRWSDGWLHTRDAAELDADNGLVTVLGRLDSQVSIGGLKVDLTEVEQTLTALPEVREAVVVFDCGAIEAYLATEPDADLALVRDGLARRLAAYKRPRRLALLPRLPRTATGKLLRDPAALRDTASAGTAGAATTH
ncbi:class I adenylate-forming enzyme family protein [Streptomyces sp. 1331.2]|uniref:class I adenylate-forming enzyme family protein n=1 Tax=Streptomyces sp. 1331.2 TaxID=1938835 RepID=UPI000BC5AA49|nr:fatty acid--CoA ligase family protein [Streptomyces sp. 1331.2]SOB79115.1 Acyl-CoA synthetase (AMP-forming)/AMP-acid ligase II [Streptomyces sp. 1331.2]